jgi:hypothetical protein
MRKSKLVYSAGTFTNFMPAVSKHRVKEEIRRYSSRQRTPKRPDSESHGSTRQQAIAKAPAK